MQVCAFDYSAHGDQRRALGPRELELQAAVTHLMWILETKLESSRIAVNALNQ